MEGFDWLEMLFFPQNTQILLRGWFGEVGEVSLAPVWDGYC